MRFLYFTDMLVATILMGVVCLSSYYSNWEIILVIGMGTSNNSMAGIFYDVMMLRLMYSGITSVFVNNWFSSNSIILSISDDIVQFRNFLFSVSKLIFQVINFK